MKRLFGIGAGILLAALVAVAPAFAIPKIMSYQGRLNDAAGMPVSATSLAMTFTIWSADTGGTTLWTATQNVDVSNGIFSVELGSDASPLPDTIFSSDTLYLGIKVDTDNEMVPRQRITSGPFTFISKTVELHVPIGSIMAWAKNLAGVPSLPAGWVECNGQTLSDPGSLLNGTVLPNINANNRFLRGSSTSGVTGGSASHSHNTGGAVNGAYGGNWVTSYSNLTQHIHSTDAQSQLPPYYEVVWIMKVK